MAQRRQPQRQSVNSRPRSQVNRQYVSVRGAVILRALAATPAHHDRRAWGRDYAAGELPTADLVALFERSTVTKEVLKASLSRTLRRLWRLGLVELKSAASWQKTMTEQQRAREKRFQQLAKDPAAAYAQYQGFVASYKMEDSYGSPAAYLEAQRAKLQRTPDVRVQTIAITKAGRALVNSDAHRTVNRHRKTSFVRLKSRKTGR